MIVFSASLTVYVPKLATSPLMTALYSSAVTWSILLAPNLGRSERVMNCAKLPFPSNMKMPFGLEPQRSLLVPSSFTSSAETKVQVPTICFLSVFPFCCARAVPATPASIAPTSIVSANLRCAFMAVLPRLLLSLLQLILEFLPHLAAQLVRGLYHRREILEHLEGPAGVDDRARVPGDALRQTRIERPAPGAAQDVDVLGRVAARAHRPEDLVEVRRVDVVVDDHHEAAEVGARLAACGQQRRLLRMAGVGLLDRDDVEHARAARLVHPHAAHAGEAGALDLVPDHARLHDALGVREVRRRQHRAGEAEDRVVAVIDALDAHHRLRAAPAGVIAGELAERALGQRVCRVHRAFEHDLGVRRHRQAVPLRFGDLVRRTAMPGRVVVFRQAEADLVAAGDRKSTRLNSSH